MTPTARTARKKAILDYLRAEPGMTAAAIASGLGWQWSSKEVACVLCYCARYTDEVVAVKSHGRVVTYRVRP